MNFQECVQFANENPLCYVATADEDQPHVRALLMWFADENGFYFGTMTPKRFWEEMEKNPKVEICFFNGAADLMAAKMMRVAGSVELLRDEALNAKIVEERAFLEDLAGQPTGPITEVFRVSSGKAVFWAMNDLLKERDLEWLEF